jgi:hypothetical protein
MRKVEGGTGWGVRRPAGTRALGGAMVLLIAACGGGGTSGTQAPSPGPLMRNDAAPGDYFVYAMSTTTTVPSGVPTNTRNSIVTYRTLASDGTNQRVGTIGGSSGVPRQPSTYNVDGALVSLDGAPGAPVVCSFSVPLALTPPFPRAVGQTWSNTTTRSCGSANTTIVTSGAVTARESLVLPIGTLDTWRTQRNVTFTTSVDVAVQQLTCWYSVTRGQMVRCDTNYQRTPNGAASPDAVTSTTELLTGAGGPGRAFEGNAQARFDGTWRVTFTGTASGTCGFLNVSATGAINGSCTSSGGAPFTVSGSVDLNGAVNVAWPGGGILTGSMTSPYEGSGTWTEGANSGSWTAHHH